MNPAGSGYGSSIVVTADGRSVYVAAGSSSAVVHFERNTGTGKLAYKGCIAETGHNPAGCTRTAKGLRDVNWLAASSDGKSLYGAGTHSSGERIAYGNLVHFQRDASTGSLTPKSCVAGPERGRNPDGCTMTVPDFGIVTALAIAPDGRMLYVAGSGIERVSRSPSNGTLSYRDCIAFESITPGRCSTSYLPIAQTGRFRRQPGGEGALRRRPGRQLGADDRHRPLRAAIEQRRGGKDWRPEPPHERPTAQTERKPQVRHGLVMPSSRC